MAQAALARRVAELELEIAEGGRVPGSRPERKRTFALVPAKFERKGVDIEAPVGAVESLREAIRRVLAKGPTAGQVWLPSFIGLGAADVASLSAGTGRFLTGIQAAGLVGAAGLVAVSVHDLNRAETSNDTLDAASDLTWGLQGLLYLSSSAPLVNRWALGLGLAGAATQTTVGMMRIKEGLRQQDLSTVKLGALDLGGGLLWIGIDLLAWEQPLLVGGYVVLMVGREAYANRRVVETWPDKAHSRLMSGCVGACAAAVDLWDETGRMLEGAERGVKRWALRRRILAEIRQQPA